MAIKHLFYIHSFITYIVSVSIVSELGLDHRDVVFIYGRRFTYRDISDIKTVELSNEVMALSSIPSYGERFVVVRRRRQIAEIDKLITALVEGKAFTAYLPLTKNYLMQLIATHPKCNGLVFLEEGLLSYTGNFDKKARAYFFNNWRGKLAALIRFPNHGYRSFYYRSCRHSYPLTIYMLHEAPGIVDLDVDVRTLKSIVVPAINPQFKVNSGYLLVIDPVVEDKMTSQESYLRTLEFCAEAFLKAKTKTMWLRFRPNHPPSGDIIALFAKYSIRAIVLPDDICVESMFYYSKNLTVIGLHSSLLYYAALWGHKSYSLLRKLFEIDCEAERKYQTYVYLPDTFFENVALL